LRGEADLAQKGAAFVLDTYRIEGTIKRPP
jgi:hypothetical protein